MPEPSKITNIVVVSDLHCGCKYGLCPPTGLDLDEGGHYDPSEVQIKLWDYWNQFWDWAIRFTQRQPFALVVNGDVVDGVHHRSVHQISHNLADQARIAHDVLKPIVKKAAAYYHIRGTEAHVGASGQEEERIAEALGAIPNEYGQHAAYEWWLDIDGHPIHILHHIGTTGSQAYEATAVQKELVESFTEAGRWGHKPPSFIVRSHRHRYIRTSVQTHRGEAESIVTPGWQLKTPFAYRIPGARLSPPQFGGIVIRQGRDGAVYSGSCVFSVGVPKPMIIEGKP